jgi:hypothetical protein
MTPRSLLRSALLLVAVLWLVASAPLSATGTVVVTTANVGGGVTKYTIAWTSTAGGAVSGNTFSVKSGRILAVKFMPNTSATQPTNLYDATLIDTDSVDILNAAATDLSNSAGRYFSFDPPLFLDGTQVLDLVIANAGAAKTGTVSIWVQ